MPPGKVRPAGRDRRSPRWRAGRAARLAVPAALAGMVGAPGGPLPAGQPRRWCRDPAPVLLPAQMAVPRRGTCGHGQAGNLQPCLPQHPRDSQRRDVRPPVPVVILGVVDAQFVDDGLGCLREVGDGTDRRGRRPPVAPLAADGGCDHVVIEVRAGGLTRAADAQPGPDARSSSSQRTPRRASSSRSAIRCCSHGSMPGSRIGRGCFLPGLHAHRVSADGRGCPEPACGRPWRWLSRAIRKSGWVVWFSPGWRPPVFQAGGRLFSRRAGVRSPAGSPPCLRGPRRAGASRPWSALGGRGGAAGRRWRWRGSWA
jgi:hypothetical protein